MKAQMPSIFLARATSLFSSSTMPALRRCFLRLPVVGADANAAPDLRPACRRMILPEPVTLKRFFAPEWVLFFGMSASTSLCVWFGVNARATRERSSGLDLGVQVLGATTLLILRHRAGEVRCFALRVLLGLRGGAG